MFSLDLGALARAAGATMLGGGLPVQIRAVGTDTRSLPPDCLFVALRGERFDGHAYLDAAAKKGAIAAVVDSFDSGHEPPLPLLVVEDTLVALGRIARHVRRQHTGKVVGVTGSNGKTTTKELVAQALSPLGEVHRTRGNLNNRIGVPLTVFDWSPSAWAAVIEMGMNEAGEIAALADIAEPEVGVITTVGPAHLEKLGSLENIARAKGELFAALSTRATAVVNVDDPLIQHIAKPLFRGDRLIGFGRADHADVRLIETESVYGGISASFEIQGQTYEVSLTIPGLHNASNAGAALACALALNVPLSDAATAMADTQFPGSRLRVLRELPDGISILDDSYNANPQSVVAALVALKELTSGRRIAVLGDMMELGARAEAMHFEIGERAVENGIAWTVAIGELSQEIVRGARSAGGRADHFESMPELVNALRGAVEAGDWLLVKGSRGMRMERVVESFESSLAARKPGEVD